MLSALNIKTGDMILLDVDITSSNNVDMNSATIGDIIQYKGTTNENYTNGYFYKYTQETVSESTEEHIEVNQTAGVTMGEFTTNVSVFKHQLQPDRNFTFTFSKVGKPKEISVWKMIGGMEFTSFTRDTVYDNSRLHQYSWVDGNNNFYFTNTEIPNANTKFYPSSSNDVASPDSTPSAWEYISTTTRRTDDPWGMWMIGGDDTPIELSDYGIYSSSAGVVGCVLSVAYFQQADAVYNTYWKRIDVQPIDLTKITGYNSSNNQILKNTQGTISWVDEL